MLNKINKLIYSSRNESKEVQRKLISIAEKIKDNISGGKTYLVIDVKQMEAQIESEKVEVEDNIGKMELDL